MGNDGNGLVEALLGVPGFRVLAVAEGPSELVVTVETVLETGRTDQLRGAGQGSGPHGGGRA